MAHVVSVCKYLSFAANTILKAFGLVRDDWGGGGPGAATHCSDPSGTVSIHDSGTDPLSSGLSFCSSFLGTPTHSGTGQVA